MDASSAEDATKTVDTVSNGWCADLFPGDEAQDPRAVAAALDQLVEQAYAVLSCCDVPGGLTEQQAIEQLLHLFERGDGFEARVKAEQLPRPS